MVINFYYTRISLHDTDSTQLWCHVSRTYAGIALVHMNRLQGTAQIGALDPVIIAFVKALVISNVDLKVQMRAHRTRMNPVKLHHAQNQSIKSR